MEILDLERDDQERFESRIAEAAEKASVSVDYETIGMYLKHNIKLPPRLQKIYDKMPHTAAWKNYTDNGLGSLGLDRIV